MKRLRIISATSLAGLQLINAGAAETQQVKPNLVVFMADDCSYFDIGCYGSENSQTPNIDKFATEGILFTNCYQAASMSSPTRHNLLTGLWPVKTGAYPNHTMAEEGTLSIVHHLKPIGYQVALIGKSHVQPKSVFPWDFEARLTENNDINFSAVDSFIVACKMKNEPFCLFVMSNQPHTPWNKGDPSIFDPVRIKLPPYYVDIPETRNAFCQYLAEINYMDMEFGKLLRKLDEHKLTDNSVVIYLSEQGNSLPFAKYTCYDAGVHSAFLVRWPGVIKPGSTSDAIVEYVDVVPTILDIAGVKPYIPMDGISILPLLIGKAKEHKQYTFSLQTTRGIISGSEYYGIRSVADKKYRYIVNLTPEATFKNLETQGQLFKKWQEKAETDTLARWLTNRYQHRPGIELYDLDKDRYCMYNIAHEPDSKHIIEKMDYVLLEWMNSCGDKGQNTELNALSHQPRNMRRE